MAKRKPKRRFSLRRVRVTPEQALATLASDTALTSGITAAAVGTYRCVTAEMAWALTALTAGEGPITVGYAHSDYSVTEIKECLEAFNAIDQGNKIAQEQSNRLIRIVGTLSETIAALNDGKPIKTRLNWLITPGDQVNMFCYNESTSILTTGAFVNGQGQFWVKDSA